MSHAMMLDTLDTGAVWSVARGLARNVDSYKRYLAACDQQRAATISTGGGNSSEESLAGFTEFFLRTCIDQVEFMESLMQPDRLRARILVWAEEEVRLKKLPPRIWQHSGSPCFTPASFLGAMPTVSRPERESASPAALYSALI